MRTTVCVNLSDADRHRLYAIAFVWTMSAEEAIRRLIREETERDANAEKYARAPKVT